jgi:HSP20 family protein
MITMTPLNSVLDRMVTMSRAMDDVLGRTNGDSESGASPRQYWLPALDAWETEQAFVVQLDLPGVAPENVDVVFDQNTLTVRGTRQPTIQAPEKGELKVFFSERADGAFSRSLRFPHYVESGKIEAGYANGVLTITIPKAEASKPRKIAVNAPVEATQVGG